MHCSSLSRSVPHELPVMTAQVLLTDFEWAGRAGTARYPYFMNRANLTWPGGASDNQLITVQHDLWWMNELLSA